jgi:hypothetical protein
MQGKRSYKEIIRLYFLLKIWKSGKSIRLELPGAKAKNAAGSFFYGLNERLPHILKEKRKMLPKNV